MSLHLDFSARHAPAYQALFNASPQYKFMAERLHKGYSYGSDTTEISLPDGVVYDQAFLDDIYDVAQQHQDLSVQMQVTAFRSLRDNPSTAKLTKLEALEVGLITYLKENMIDGWLYEQLRPGIYLPWLVESVAFHSPHNHDEKPYVTLRTTANSPCEHYGSKSTNSIVRHNHTLHYEDVIRKTVPEILANSGLFHETPELKQNYMQQHVDFLNYRPRAGEQFYAWGYLGPFGASYWWRDRESRIIPDGDPAVKVVNDESAITRKFVEAANPNFWRKQKVEQGFDQAPYHPFILTFALDTHQNYWVHVANIAPYEYDPSLKHKLILPADHRDLIDLLTNDTAATAYDLIAGKGRGTTVLSLGPPGTGKTLTAEVYSEVVGKPLYSVYSGQLGLNGTQVETNLNIIFERATRWGAILLIDEADVYIRERGNDTEHNAIVASFLRTMEQFTGLLFMTSNRVNDVDDAIRSRATAIINYAAPTIAEAPRVWAVYLDGFKLTQPFNDAILQSIKSEDLANAFKNVSGRDIRNVLGLVARVMAGRPGETSHSISRTSVRYVQGDRIA